MGLITPLTSSNVGVSFETAYCKIDLIQANKTELTVQVSFFASQEARTANKAQVSSGLYRIPTSEIVGPLFPSVYGWLKSNVDSLKTATDA